MGKKVPIQLPKDTKERVTRALTNLEAAQGSAVCFWRGYVYPDYDRDVETAHLLQCPEYPDESKKALLN